ncbi:hypothetical protein ES703_101333 [subsurface metagenome]
MVFEVNEGEYTPFFGVPLRMCSDDIKLRGLNSFTNGTIQLYASATNALTESKIAYPVDALLEPILSISAPVLKFNCTHAGKLDYSETAAIGGQTFFRVDGSGYEYSMSVPFDIPDVEESYFPTADLSKIKLKWKETAQKPVISVVLDELVKE